jgi:threonine dehydrogenase-like Zn-dependent dehydrogenase
MKAVTFAAPIPRYVTTLLAGKISDALYVGPHACTQFVDVASPALPNNRWVRIKTRLGGICGSDLAIVSLGASPSTSPLSSFPFVIGHENVGTVAELGSAVRGWSVGDRVTVNPLLCCEPRGIEPRCVACAGGQHSRCAHFTDGAIAPGMLIGTTRAIGGSWGEEFVAHESQLVRVPDAVTDEEAVLTEPFACCVHAVRNALPAAGDRCLVIGAGTMGLLTVAALHALAPDSSICALARHAFQAEHAKKLGASDAPLTGAGYLEAVAEIAKTRLLTPIIGRPIGVGGFDITFVTASNSRAIEDAMRYTREGGTIVMIGNATALKAVDWTPLWLKEIRLQGTLAYGAHGAAGENAFNEALRIVADKRAAIGHLVTHTLPLGDIRNALAVARAKGGEHSVKVALRA